VSVQAIEDFKKGAVSTCGYKPVKPRKVGASDQINTMTRMCGWFELYLDAEAFKFGPDCRQFPDCSTVGGIGVEYN